MSWRSVFPVFMALGLASIVVPATALAADDQATSKAQAAPTQLKLETGPRRSQGEIVKGQLVLTATLTSKDKGVSDHTVQFYQAVDLLGPRFSLLGSAETDTTGTATLLFAASEPGSVQFKAVFAGDSQFAPQEASATEQMKESVSLFPQERLPLASVAAWAAVIVRLVGFAVWIVLLSVLVRTTLGIRAAARPQSSEAPPERTQPRAERSVQLSP